MGERANIVIRADESGLAAKEGVFLYTHWRSRDLPEILRIALASGRNYWNDEPYLARIIFDEMVDNNQGGETGFGISTRLGDNEPDLLVLWKGSVYLVPEAEYDKYGFVILESHTHEYPNITFRDYIGTEPRTWTNLTSKETTIDPQ